uniref:IF rod domain-containing protein n=1 Tax=Pelodiscus sinensis TaxID=13735 RepID=K7G0Z3_PELSI
SSARLETEQAVCDSVQKDTQGLRKITEDTNFLRTKLELELEGLREELAHLRKSHQEEVEALMALIASSDVTVEVDNPQRQGLGESIARIRKQYENVADQNRADAEQWYKDKFDTLTQEANANTQVLEEAKSELAELRRQLQGPAEGAVLCSAPRQVDTLERALKDTEGRYAEELAKLNQVVGKLQHELGACRADLERQARDYEALLDVKSKLENEIGQYSQLIEGVVAR